MIPVSRAFSAGDGVCADADTDGDGVLDEADADDNNDGIPDSTEGYGNSDSDLIADIRDLDSDNDGIPDNIEAQTTAGYAVPGTAVDAQGRLTAYGAAGLTPVNTDGADNSDYLDTDSDNVQGNDTTEAGLTLASADADGDGLDDAVDTDDSAFGPANAGVANPATTYPNANGTGNVGLPRLD